ncbi:DUF2637 domain-containing protein [Streptomyces sp. NPDC012510]|uniref:DUF2637 domain-containing protein n=1 Tax=Streptomyces sp. NPDC012510 TaxID=3364838 RepID=UPI0036F0C384
MLSKMTPQQITAAERTLSIGTWAITFGAVLFSVLTVTPLVERVTPDGWAWTAPILPLVVDAAVVIVVRLDATVARLDGHAGAWPVILRWLTGLMTIALNVGDSALAGDLVGVGVHLVAPVLLIVTAEAGLAYRRAITSALARIQATETAERERREREQRAERERREREQRERQDREREEREREQDRAERLERERLEAEERRERERLEAEAAERRAEREHSATLAREQAEREERRERERLEAEERAERMRLATLERERMARVAEQERKAREAKERAAVSTGQRRVAHGRQPVSAEAAHGAHGTAGGAHDRQPVSTATGPGEARVSKRMLEGEARRVLAEMLSTGATQRQIADRTGWSTGWVASRCKELAAA